LAEEPLYPAKMHPSSLFSRLYMFVEAGIHKLISGFSGVKAEGIGRSMRKERLWKRGGNKKA